MVLTRVARKTMREIASIAEFCAGLKSARAAAPPPGRRG
jgi:hypothetical protein